MLILMNGAPSDGSRQLRILNHWLEYTGTCMSYSFDLRSTADALVVPPSLEESGLASGGDLRS